MTDKPEASEGPDVPGRTVVVKQRGPVPTLAEWYREATALVRTLMARDNLRAEQVVTLLQSRGVQETDRGFKEKVANGSFSFAWFLQLVVALERQPYLLVSELTLPKVDPALRAAVLVAVDEQRRRHSERALVGVKRKAARRPKKSESDGPSDSGRADTVDGRAPDNKEPT